MSYVGKVTGGCLNPAIGIGLVSMANVFKDDEAKAKIDAGCGWNGFWIMLLGPLLGGILAGVFYMLMHKP